MGYSVKMWNWGDYLKKIFELKINKLHFTLFEKILKCFKFVLRFYDKQKYSSGLISSIEG